MGSHDSLSENALADPELQGAKCTGMWGLSPHVGPCANPLFRGLEGLSPPEAYGILSLKIIT